MTTPTVDIQEVTRRIVQAALPRKIVLFGSRAGGQGRPDSDWDILVIADSDLARGWWRKGDSDLENARMCVDAGRALDTACFHAQQAAEKALKAVLCANAVEYPFTHNVQLLIDLLPAGLSAPQTILAAADLTPYAVATRYPGEVEPVTAEERAEAVRVATIVVHWAESLLKAK